MKRLIIVMLTIAMAAALSGCESNVQADAPEPGEGSSSGSAPAPTPAADLEAMSTDGPGESAAVSALPDAVQEAKQMRESAGLAWPDLDGAEPLFTAYLIAVDMDGQSALFEVRADMIPHSIYAYHKAFDAATIIWTPSEMSSSPRAEPRSEAERSAVASVESAMRDSFPDSAIAASVYGYRFVYAKDGAALITIEVATDGSVISAG